MKHKETLQNIRDLVLFRYDTTGVFEAIKKAVALKQPIAVYNVENLTSMASFGTPDKCFTKCFLVQKGTSLKQLVNHYMIKKYQQADASQPQPKLKFAYAEALDGRKMSEHEFLLENNTILRIVLDKNG